MLVKCFEFYKLGTLELELKDSFSVCVCVCVVASYLGIRLSHDCASKQPRPFRVFFVRRLGTV